MYKTLQDFVGNTPLVRLVRIPGADNDKRGNVILAKLEGNNPAGSVKDRIAKKMTEGIVDILEAIGIDNHQCRLIVLRRQCV